MAYESEFSFKNYLEATNMVRFNIILIMSTSKMKNIKVEGRSGCGGESSANVGHRSGNNYNRQYDCANNIAGNNFTGRIPELEGFIFNVSTVSYADSCEKSLKEIANYLATNLKYGGDKIQEIILNRVDINILKPTNPGINATRAENICYKTVMKMLIQQETSLVENSKKAYTTIWRQCTNYMRAKLLTTANWDRISQDKDLTGLMTAIRGLSNKFKGHSDEYLAIIRVIGQVYTFYQGKLSDDGFKKQFSQ